MEIVGRVLLGLVAAEFMVITWLVLREYIRWTIENRTRELHDEINAQKRQIDSLTYRVEAHLDRDAGFAHRARTA